MIPLNAEQINNQLTKSGLDRPYRLHLFECIDSTNQYLKEIPSTEQLEICCAEMQTAGRGRFGRQWHSPSGENIYCSIRIPYAKAFERLAGLSLVVSLAVRAMLHQLNPLLDINIKWPNDLLWQHKKLCGTLIEMRSDIGQSTQIIIGIGLNVSSDTKNKVLDNKPWCSLYEMTSHFYDRNQLIAQMICHLEKYLRQFFCEQFKPFMQEWARYDYLANKRVTVLQNSKSIRGIVKGVNSYGQLLLEDEQGGTHELLSGDTTLHQ